MGLVHGCRRAARKMADALLVVFFIELALAAVVILALVFACFGAFS
jgi:hypothetical protein